MVFGSGFGPRRAARRGAIRRAPVGYVVLVDSDGMYLVDPDGAYLVELA